RRATTRRDDRQRLQRRLRLRDLRRREPAVLEETGWAQGSGRFSTRSSTAVGPYPSRVYPYGRSGRERDRHQRSSEARRSRGAEEPRRRLRADRRRGDVEVASRVVTAVGGIVDQVIHGETGLRAEGTSSAQAI